MQHLNLEWNCVVESVTRVWIPELSLTYSENDRRDYIRDKECQSWGRYSPIAKAGRMILRQPTENKLMRRFAEIHTALALEEEGWTCWGGVLLFREKRKTPAGKGPSLSNTEIIRAHWRWQWPKEIHEWEGQPRNPDIVAYNKGRWRFCEVKLSESIASEQLTGLALLHLITGAPVAVLRTVPDSERSREPKMRLAKIAYRDGAKLDWILDSFKVHEC